MRPWRHGPRDAPPFRVEEEEEEEEEDEEEEEEEEGRRGEYQEEGGYEDEEKDRQWRKEGQRRYEEQFAPARLVRGPQSALPRAPSRFMARCV